VDYEKISEEDKEKLMNQKGLFIKIKYEIPIILFLAFFLACGIPIFIFSKICL